MSYTVQQLSNISGVTVRTLHHYDEIGLLLPSRRKENGYRFYEEKDLLKLQQIMFFKELDFPLPEIKKIMDDPKFNQEKALREHKNLIELKQKRLKGLVITIDKTIKKLTKQKNMKDEELYKAFKDHDEKYAAEAKEKWSHTEAYKESTKRVAKMSKEDMVAVQKAADELMLEIVSNMKFGPTSPAVQKLIDRHYNALRTFYEPNLELYKGLAEMYVADPRFTAYYEKYANGLAEFMKVGMLYYCETNK
jgi:DNA-binding transcriptional MerR regulator